jgi:hypothetical protein
MKIYHKVDNSVIYNFVIIKGHSKLHFHHKNTMATELYMQPSNGIIKAIIT